MDSIERSPAISIKQRNSSQSIPDVAAGTTPSTTTAGATPSQSLLSRTIGSISSLGSFSNVPGFSTIVDYSTGFFVRNQEDTGKVKDVTEVSMATPPAMAHFFVEEDEEDSKEEEGDLIGKKSQHLCVCVCVEI